jgi:hypothetical protein
MTIGKILTLDNFFLISQNIYKGAEGRNPKYTGSIQGKA